MTHIYRPPPHPFVGGNQPLAGRKLTPQAEAAAVDTVLTGWELKIIQWPESNAYWLPRRLLPIVEAGTTESGAWSSIGEAEGLFVGASTAQAPIASDGASTVEWLGAATASAAWTADGESTVTWTGQSLASGDWSSSGEATVEWNGASFSAAELSSIAAGEAFFESSSVPDTPPFGYRPSLKIIIDIWSPTHELIWSNGFLIPESTTAGGALSSTGVAEATFAGSSLASGAISSSGEATVVFVSDVQMDVVPKGRRHLETIVASWQQRLGPLWAVNPYAPFSSIPAAPRPWLYPILDTWKPKDLRYKPRVLAVHAGAQAAAGALSSEGTATFEAVGASLASAPISADGTATLEAVGQSQASGAIAADGTGALEAIGQSTASGVINGEGAATMDMVGQSIAEGQGAMTSDGSSEMIMVGQATAQAVLDSVGIGNLQAVGTSEGGADEEAAEDWPLMTEAERRRRKQRQMRELSLILARVMPIITKGKAEPITIDITLH